MIVRKTTKAEARRINELFAICFEFPYANCPIEDPETDDCVHWAAFTDDGEMMSNFTIPSYTVNFDANQCRMAGIGGVATLPQYRRQGGIRACFEAALPEMYADGYDFSFLYPFSTAYYRKFGYECCVQKYGWEVDLTLLNPPAAQGYFRLAEKTRPLTEAVRAVDSLWERHFNMMVQHREEDYKWVAEADPAVRQEFTYVWFSAAGTPKAYTTFRAVAEGSGRNLQCSRFCFADREGFAGLLQLFKSLSADHAFVKFQTPAIPALQYLMPEWSLGAAKWNILQNSGMIRVINVKRVLEKARYEGSGSLTLQIRDPQIRENCGTFRLTFRDGKAVSVENTDDAPDAAMEISTFSALIAGVCDFSQAKYTFSGMEIFRESPCFRQVFYPKPLMITDFF